MTALTGRTTVEIEQYYERVRAALQGLPAEVREELLEDLPAHLAEVLAEQGAEEQDGAQTLTDRLGEPEAYAEELRVAAGLEPAVADRSLDAGSGSAIRLAAAARRIGELADRFDVAAAKLVGYPRLTDLFRAVRPGWWVLRGWVVAQFLCGTHDRASWNGFVPSAGGNRLAGLLLMLLAIIASIWLGQQSQRMARWGRRLVGAAGLVIALWGALVLADNVGGTAYAYQNPGYVGYSSPYDNVSDLYPFDSAGKPLTGVRLFDQQGNPVNLGSGGCRDGSTASGAASDQWTYPLCPSDPGPFQAGPGPVTSAGPDGTVTSPAVPPASTSPSSAPSASHTPKPSGTR
ncbi:MAG: hypothetical protein ABI140_16845 [Jatrophihabitantaceae bacterium]